MLHNRCRTIPLVGSRRWPWATLLRVILSPLLCHCYAYGAPTCTPVWVFLTICEYCRCYHHNVRAQVHLQYELWLTLVFVCSVILVLRTYAFSGRKKPVLALLSIAFFGLVGVNIWVSTKGIFRLSRKHCSLRCIPDSSVESVSPSFTLFNHGGCFAFSDLPGSANQLGLVMEGHGTVQIRFPIGQPSGVCIRLSFDALIWLYWSFAQLISVRCHSS